MKSKLYIVHGLQRSGNHAIISWMLSQKNMVFFNNVYPIKHLLEGRLSVEENLDYEKWYNENILKKYPGTINSLKRFFKRSLPTMVSFEDLDIEFRPFNTRDNVAEYNILIVRDIKNLLASRIHRAWKIEHPAYPREYNDLMRRVIVLWKKHAKELLGDTNYLDNLVGIYYNSWFDDRMYRKQICDNLGIPFSDNGKEIVTSYGGGSSFDGDAYNGKADQMKVMERYKMLKGDEEKLFWEIMEDKELLELDKRLKDHN